MSQYTRGSHTGLHGHHSAHGLYRYHIQHHSTHGPHADITAHADIIHGCHSTHVGLTQACTDVPHATAHVWASDITYGRHNTHVGLTQAHAGNTDVIAPTASHSTHMGLRPAQTSHGRHTHVNSTQTSHVDVTAHMGHTGTCRCHGTHGYHTIHMGITRISQHTHDTTWTHTDVGHGHISR